MKLAAGDRVWIRSAAGECAGEVIHAEDPASLPSIHGAPEAARVRTIMAEWGVAQVVLIRHQHEGEPVTFIALGNEDGTWRDLQRQPLTIERQTAT